MPRKADLVSEAVPPRAPVPAPMPAPAPAPAPQRQTVMPAMKRSPSQQGEMKFLIQTMSGQMDEALNALVEGKEKEDEAERTTQRVREHLRRLHEAVESAVDSSSPLDAATLGEKLAAVQSETDRLLEGKRIAERQAAVLLERNAELKRQLGEARAERDHYRSGGAVAAGLAEGLAPGVLQGAMLDVGGTMDEAALCAEVAQLRARVQQQGEQLAQARGLEEALAALEQAEVAAAAASAAAEASLAATAQLNGSPASGRGGRRALPQYDR